MQLDLRLAKPVAQHHLYARTEFIDKLRVRGRTLHGQIHAGGRGEVRRDAVSVVQAALAAYWRAGRRRARRRGGRGRLARGKRRLALVRRRLELRGLGAHGACRKARRTRLVMQAERTGGGRALVRRRRSGAGPGQSFRTRPGRRQRARLKVRRRFVLNGASARPPAGVHLQRRAVQGRAGGRGQRVAAARHAPGHSAARILCAGKNAIERGGDAAGGGQPGPIAERSDAVIAPRLSRSRLRRGGLRRCVSDLSSAD